MDEGCVASLVCDAQAPGFRPAPLPRSTLAGPCRCMAMVRVVVRGLGFPGFRDSGFGFRVYYCVCTIKSAEASGRRCPSKPKASSRPPFFQHLPGAILRLSAMSGVFTQKVACFSARSTAVGSGSRGSSESAWSRAGLP